MSGIVVEVEVHLNFLEVPSSIMVGDITISVSGCPVMSRVMRKPTFCICENKDADQLCGNHTADQRLYFRYKDSTITLLSKSEISSL